MIDASRLHKAAGGARRWSGTMSAVLQQHAPLAAKLFLAAARGAAPFKTGKHVRDTLTVRMSHSLAGIRLELYGSKIARWTITGTRPHVIEPRRASVLSFYWDKVGARVAFARVNHPGTKPNDWRRKALASARPEIRSLGLQVLRAGAAQLRQDMSA